MYGWGPCGLGIGDEVTAGCVMCTVVDLVESPVRTIDPVVYRVTS